MKKEVVGHWFGDSGSAARFSFTQQKQCKRKKTLGCMIYGETKKKKYTRLPLSLLI